MFTSLVGKQLAKIWYKTLHFLQESKDERRDAPGCLALTRRCQLEDGICAKLHFQSLLHHAFGWKLLPQQHGE